jgi:hypothetical protein
MAIDYTGLAFPKGTPRILEQHRKGVEADAKLAKAYEAVNLRDLNRCVVTGVPLTWPNQDAKRRREHHHLAGRRVQPSWRTNPHRIVLVSGYVHELLTCHALLVLGDDARKPLKFAWNRALISRGKEPFRLRPSVNGERAA